MVFYGPTSLITYLIKNLIILLQDRNLVTIGWQIDAFICSIGTGGTLAGMSDYLKERNKNIIIGLADPFGSAMYNFFKKGKLESEGSSITEGIGQGRITKNLENILIDDFFQISMKLLIWSLK